MIVPVSIKYRQLEDLCYNDKWEGIVCDDYKDEIEVSPEDVEFERADIEDIVDMYLDDVIDILLNDARYREKLEKRLRERNNFRF